MSHNSWYIRPALDPQQFKKAVDMVADQVIADAVNGLPIDVIAVTGVSGLTVGSAVAYETGIPLCVVRKGRDSIHCDFTVEYDQSFSSYIIVDDLVSTGDTLDNIHKAIRNASPDSTPFCSKVYLYNQPKIKRDVIHEFLGLLCEAWAIYFTPAGDGPYKSSDN